MLKELIEYGSSMKEEMKVTLREVKKNLQRSNNEGKEARIQTNDLKHKEEIKIQPEQKKEIRIFLKNEDSIRRLWDISNCVSI